MERRLKQKSFSDVLEEAIKQRWGTKRKTSLVNFPRNIKKYKVQTIGFATSQQHSQGTSIADHESFCQSQPIVSEKKLPYCAKQAVKGWKPPLKIFPEIKDRSATDANSITSLKLPENKSESKGYMDDNLRENFSQANLVYSEVKNGSENVLDKYAAHEENLALSNTTKINKHENKERLGCTSLALKDDAGSVYQDITQTSNFQCIKSQCSPVNTDSVAQENASYCTQSSIVDKEADLENPTLLDQASNKSSGYELAISAVNDNNSISKMTESIANSEEILSNTNTEADLKSDDIFCLSQQSTQPYVLNDNITYAENTIIIEEEIEKPSDNCEVFLLSPKANLTTDAVNEDTTKDSTFYSTESIPNENFSIAMEEKLVPGKGVQDTMDSKEFKEFLKVEPSRSGMLSSIISKSKMAQNQQNSLVSKQNDKCISETHNSFNAKNCANENVTGGDGSDYEESMAITTNSRDCNTNKECEKAFPLEIKSGSTETIVPTSCDQTNSHTDAGVYTSADKYDENKTLVFDTKKYTEGLEEKFKSVFHFENYVQETLDKDNTPVFDNIEEPPIKPINTTPKQDAQIKISENCQACIAAVKLSENSNAYQKSEDGFLEETKTDKSKDDIVISTVACNGSLLERTCKSSEYALKWTEHTAKESYNKEMIEANYSTVILPVGTASLQRNQSTLKFDEEDQTVKSPNNTKSLEVKENVPLIPVERRDNVTVSDETKPLAENTNSEEEESSKYQQTLKVISTVSSQSTVRHDDKIHSENKTTSQSNGNDFVFEREALAENNSEEKCIKYQRNTILENENINSGNKFASQPAAINSETLHAIDQKRACVVNLKSIKKNLVEDCSSPEIEKYVVDETKSNHHSWNERQKDSPEDVINAACFNSSTKKVKPLSTDLTDHISTSDVEVKNDSEILNNFKAEKFQHKNETEKETGDLISTDNEEPGHITFKNHKQPENKYAVLIPDVTNDEVSAKNNTDFSEMEDDFGLTVSQILRIEDECKQKMFMPEMSPLQWAQKVKESRRKVQAVIQEITMLNAMLKKVRKEVWLPQSSANTEESTSTAESFNTFPRLASYRWNRNLNSKSGQNMSRE